MIFLNVRERLRNGDSIYDLNLRVVFYARVSTDHELQSTSIVNQVDYFSHYIKSNCCWTFVRGYVDEGISGKSVLGRVHFLKMIEDAKLGLFDLILTKSVSRFARNTIDSIFYTNVLLEHDVGVYFLNDNINTFYGDSEFRLTLMASIAQDELRKLSESVQFGLSQSIDRGVVLGNSNIFGYKKSSGKLVVVLDEAKVVKDIFDYFVTFLCGYSDVAKYINLKYQLSFDSTKIKRILTNYKYKGYYCGRKSKVIDYKRGIRKSFNREQWVIYKDYDKVPPIVSENVWDRVQKIIFKKSRKVLSGKKIFCGVHQRKMIIKKKKYKDKYYYYFICPNCMRFSSTFLDRYFKEYSFIVIFFRGDGLFDFFVKKI